LPSAQLALRHNDPAGRGTRFARRRPARDPSPTDHGVGHPAPSWVVLPAREARQAAAARFFGQAFRARLVYSIFPGVWCPDRANSEAIMRIDRIVFIFCASGWVLEPALGRNVVDIGVTRPLTGAFAAPGNRFAPGATMAGYDVNKAGGKIALIVENDTSDPAAAVATAQKRIEKAGFPAPIRA